MSSYHALSDPITKEAMPLLKTVGRSLLNRGTWGTAAHAGAKLALKGGRMGQAGGYLATGAGAMQKASPLMLGYGLAGMAGDVSGKFELPGSSLALAAATPFWGALSAAPGAIRSGRLATGGYDDAIKQDAQRGAQQAGTDWITATQADGRNAYDPTAYRQFLQANSIDTTGADRYLSGGPAERPNWWHRLGNAFDNPTGNVMPEVQRGIYAQMRKGASGGELEKAAMAAAAKAAWNLSRAVGGSAMRGVGLAKGPMGSELANFARSGLRSAGAGWQAGAPSQFRRAHPNIGKWGGRAATAGFVGLSAIDGFGAATEEKPYDELAVQQEGYAGGQAGIRQGLAGMTPFQRRMAQFDPSLAVQRMDGQLPGAIANWEQQNGQAYQPGFLGSISQIGKAIGGAASGAWNGRGTPGFYNYDGAGNTNYL